MAIYVNFEGLSNASSSIMAVKSKFEAEMQALETIVNETTLNDWKGPDADLFVSNTKAKLANLKEQYNNFLVELNKSIEDNSESFKETQNRNIRMQD